MRLVTGLFPRSWRERYGEEVGDHLARSTRPVRDRLDLLMALPMVWGDEHLRRFPMLITRTRTRASAAVLCATGVITTTRATSELQNGISELPQHWWSATATLPLAAAAAVLAIGELTTRRTRQS